ncbi:hypothetical protein BIV57_07100 [Mangrovactinospora gilvigrisea]|uniref:Peptidase M64 n=1 Tax=Mangrovactinospora gilvigrisea TaxID=1428644 RepID=A0A1J7C9K6_9ACTN|nr:M64 family metallopeptidase [Mangrovactinospora gilvigrisea]OIV38204.1 hypothetical protein BIV57_07100 [Mangrovactinospora gilvigrisea]
MLRSPERPRWRLRRLWTGLLLVAVAGLVGAAWPPDPPARDGARIELLFVGDGFTRGQEARFQQDVDRLWRAFAAEEPYRTYREVFRERRLDLASPLAGVGSRERATPLGMHYWCHGVERLLCADEHRVAAVTGGNEPRRRIIAVANSTTYGGAGGSASTTVGGGNPDAGPVFQHEIGHTLGGLGDEYDGAYGDDPARLDYPNLGRPGRPVPWRRWLGARDPSGGRVGAYAGADGVLRPTRDSIMRTLGSVYNLPSREALIEEFYRVASPLVAHGRRGRGGHLLWVRPLHLIGHAWIRVRWTVDGRAWSRPGCRGCSIGATFDTGWLPPGRHRVSAVVRDATPWVRDEAFRRRSMTRIVNWSVG